MEEKLNDLIKDNKLLQRIVDELNEVKTIFIDFDGKLSGFLQEYDFSGAKKEATRKVDEYNKLLCLELKNQSAF